MAMEFVDGQPCDEWIAARNGTLRDTVSLFRGICAGVGHAHQRGVLHRDLKPANVLVTPDGVPKIVDFGLACRQGDSFPQVTLTRQGDVFGTVAWMSPEQASGRWEEVDALSDIHALGGILFTLVAGRPPIDPALPPAAQLLAAQSPDRPCLTTACGAAVPADLQALCAKCLAGQRSERYRSVAELESDLDRWLRGEPVRVPVRARLYRARKWLRRRWLPAGLILAAACGAGAAAWQYWRAAADLEREKFQALTREADQRARSLRDAQELVAELLVDVRAKFEEAGHPEWTEEAEQKLAAFPWDTGNGTVSAFDPRKSRARAALARGDLLSEKGQWGGAIRAYQEAAEAFTLLANDDPSAGFAQHLIASRLGESAAAAKLGFHREAIRAAERAVEVLADTGQAAERQRVHPRVTNALCVLGESVLAKPNHRPAALELLRGAMEPWRNVTIGSLAASEATALSRLAGCRAMLLCRPETDANAAGSEADRSLEAARHVVALEGLTPLNRRVLISALVARANVDLALDSSSAARSLLEEASGALGKERPAISLSAAPFVALAEAWQLWATKSDARGDLDAAVEGNQRAIDVWERLRLRARDRMLMTALSRLSLANARLGAKGGRVDVLRRYGAATTARFLSAKKDGNCSAEIALNALDACSLLRLAGVPDRDGGRPPWSEVAASAREWLGGANVKLTPEERARLDGLAATQTGSVE